MNFQSRVRRWFGVSTKSGEGSVTRLATGGGGLDYWRRKREPSASDLLRELKSTAWACANINATVCASFAPKLYVRTGTGERRPKVSTKALPWDHPLAVSHKALGAMVEEVTEHPLVTLFNQVNPQHNGFELWEITQLYLEVFGVAYWYVEDGPLGIPAAIWPLPSQHVTPRREQESKSPVDWYDYTGDGSTQRFHPDDIVRFAFPDPRDPYTGCLSPLRSVYEQVTGQSQYAALRNAIYDNKGLPGAILSPSESIGEDEADRLEEEYRQKFSRGGQGRVLVTRDAMSLQILSHSMGDLSALAEVNATKDDVANGFGVPMPYLVRETNLANLQAADLLHAKFAIRPRQKRRDQKLNEENGLVKRYDVSGRLFLASEDPVPDDREYVLRRDNQDLNNGTRTINEIRSERGLTPVAWGNKPYRVPYQQVIDTESEVQ